PSSTRGRRPGWSTSTSSRAPPGSGASPRSRNSGNRSARPPCRSRRSPVLTATVRPPTRAAEFTLRAIAWSLGIFAMLRAPWVEARALLPLVRAQGAIAVGLAGTPSLPVDATLACSGADALALCVGAILAYPVSWRRRLFGAAGGVVLILSLNTLRIGSLG